MWWETLNLAQKIYFCIATPASLLLVVQIVLMLIGIGGDASGDVDVDVDVDVDTGDFDLDAGFSVFTVRGLVAFFAVGGWVGYTLADGNLGLAITLSVVAGAAALVGVAFLMKWILSLQSAGNLNYKDAVGKIGEVYLTVPAAGNGKGKINILLNERFVELSAVTKSDEPIPTGAKIKVLDVEGDDIVVEKL